MDVLARRPGRMAIWVRHPPSRRIVHALVAVILLTVLIVALERLDLWPDWARRERLPRQPMLR